VTILLLAGCGQANTATCLDLPASASTAIASIDDAFDLLLNSDDRSVRYSATLYLKLNLKGELTSHYGKLLFQLSNLKARLKVYESMGFAGDGGTAQLLAHYLLAEEEIDAKVQIICSLGSIGSDASPALRSIEYVRNKYPEQFRIGRSQGGTVILRSRSNDAAWIIREDSMSPEEFVALANRAIDRIR